MEVARGGKLVCDRNFSIQYSRGGDLYVEQGITLQVGDRAALHELSGIVRVDLLAQDFVEFYIRVRTHEQTYPEPRPSAERHMRFRLLYWAHDSTYILSLFEQDHPLDKTTLYIK